MTTKNIAKTKTKFSRDREKFLKQAVKEAEKTYPELEKLKKILTSQNNRIVYTVTYTAV